MTAYELRFSDWSSDVCASDLSLAALQLSKLAGSRAIVTSRDDEKLRRALDLRAYHAINGATQDSVKQVMALTGKRGVDVVIENVGQAVWSSALKSLVRGGRIVTCEIGRAHV